MREEILPETLEIKKDYEYGTVKSRKRWLNALFVCSILAINFGIFGFLVSALSLFGFLADKPNLSRLGTGLITAVFLLLIFSAHCLDKIGAAEKAIRIERCGQQGMSGDDCR